MRPGIHSAPRRPLPDVEHGAVISSGCVAGTGFFQGQLTDERQRSLIQETHTKRAGTPEDIAETAWFLASPGATHITGQTLHVNGGAFTTR